MSNVPLMPMATAVWLVENTTLTFKQIANFCNLHEIEIQGIADGEVAKGIMAYNPIISGQLTREEIELSSKDESRHLQIKNKSYWNYNNLDPKDPVALGLFSQKDLIEAIEKAERRIKREKKEKEKAKLTREVSNID